MFNPDGSIKKTNNAQVNKQYTAQMQQQDQQQRELDQMKKVATVKIGYHDAKETTIKYFNEKIIPRNDVDSRVYAYCVDVPKLPVVWAFVAGFINLILPGIGTMITSASGFSTDQKTNKTQLAIGALQFMTWVYLIGWAWAIYWAYLIISKSFSDQQESQKFLN